jgi:hypothetical protein
MVSNERYGDRELHPMRDRLNIRGRQEVVYKHSNCGVPYYNGNNAYLYSLLGWFASLGLLVY